LQLLSFRAPERTEAPVLQSCTSRHAVLLPKRGCFLLKKESSKGALVEKFSVLLKQKEKTGNIFGWGLYIYIYIYVYLAWF